MSRSMCSVPCSICGESLEIPRIEYSRSKTKVFICRPGCGEPVENRECILCSRYFRVYESSGRVVCGPKCPRLTCRTSYKPMNLCGKYSPRRRAIMRDGDNIDRIKLLMMYDWKCHICRASIDPRLRYPHPMCYTCDHIVPLCMLPVYTWDAVAPAHLKCNIDKGDKYATD